MVFPDADGEDILSLNTDFVIILIFFYKYHNIYNPKSTRKILFV